MPYIFEANEPMISYRGIIVYHVYKDNSHGSGWREYLYTLNECGCEDDDDVFDIRDIPGYAASLSIEKNLVDMLKDGKFGSIPPDYDCYISEDDSKAGRCPVCGSGDLDYDSFEVFDHSIDYPFECKKCGITGKEQALLSFNGFELD